MSQSNEIKIRMNENGEPDVDYYLARAQQLRSEALQDMYAELNTWFAGLLRKATAGLHHGGDAAASH